MPQENAEFYATPDGGWDATEAHRHPSAPATGAPTSFGGTFKAVIDLYQKSFAPLLGLSLTWALIYGFSNYMMERSLESLLMGGQGIPGLFFFYLLFSVAGAYFWIVGIKRIDNLYRQRPTGGEFASGVSKFLPIVAFFIVYSMISGVGLLFCLVPGIILGILLYVGDLAVILEDRGPLEALERSWHLVKGASNWFYVFGLLVVMGLLIMIPSMIAGGIVALASGGSIVASNIVSAIITAIAFPFGLTLNYLIFKGLIARQQSARGEAYTGRPQSPIQGPVPRGDRPHPRDPSGQW